MKKLSDYVGEEALLLWADLLDSFTEILADKEIADSIRAKKPALVIAKLIVQKKPKEALGILTRIDDTEPVNGLTLITRLASVIMEIVSEPTITSFFGLPPVGKSEEIPSGSVTESTEAGESQDISLNM